MFRLICGAFLLVSGASLHAADTPPKYELTAFGGFTTGGTIDAEEDGDDLDVDDGTLGGLVFHVTSPAGGQFEFAYWRDDTALEGSGLFIGEPSFDVDIEYFQVGGTYPSSWGEGVHPYIVATIGAARFTPDDSALDDETVFAGTAGGGVRFNLTEHLALKLEGRAFFSLFDSNSSIFCSSIGGSGSCAIRTSGDLVTRWTALAGVAYRF